MTVVAVRDVADLRDVVRHAATGVRLLPVAGATKPGLSTSSRDKVVRVDVSALRGIVDYDPAEMTITASAATPVAEVASVLAEHGQYLPFDAPWARAGATLGGAVAAGASGSNAFRHGGVRDFVIGVRFVDGTGRSINGGGRVVKNAAGFDLPKLLVGSMGRLGIMEQLSFKVFPRPHASTTCEFTFGSTAPAFEAGTLLARSSVQLDALDIAPGGRLLARLGGRAEVLDARADRLAHELDMPSRRHHAGDDERLWATAGELAWVPARSVIVRVGLPVRRLLELDAALERFGGVVVRYVLGGAVAWVAWPRDAPLVRLDAGLRHLGLTGMTLSAPADRPLVGTMTGGVFRERITRAVDPESRFLEV